MSGFNELWEFIVNRSQGFPTVQERYELEHVFNLMQGCESYLEVGTAEGNSLYVLEKTLLPGGNHQIVIIDYGEKHTAGPRNYVIRNLHHPCRELYGNSHTAAIIKAAHKYSGFDCVMIDAGHAYEDVIADAIAYGSLAAKYIFFHDICLPEVNRAFEWYCKQRPECKSYKIINSTTFGYGIIAI